MEIKSNEWHVPILTNYKMECCDCGLIHEIDFKVLKKVKVLETFKDGTEDAEYTNVSENYRVAMRARRK